MKKKFRQLISLLCVGALVFTLLTACSDPTDMGETTGSGDYKDEIHIAVNAVPETFDLVNTTSTAGFMIALGSVFETLVTLDSSYQIRPELAESFTINDDATKYTYKLRQGVKFHNGETMTADDVVASMNRWIDAFGSASDMCGDNRFIKEDENTVSISFDSSQLYFNELITKGAQRPIVVPKSVIDSADPDTGIITDYIGTGPYKFDEWAADRYVKLTKFDDYVPYGTEGDADGWYGYKVAATPTVYYDIVTDTSTRVAGIQSGEYDFSYTLGIDDYSLFKDNSDYEIYDELVGQLLMIYNNKSGIASNATFRRAINTALNIDDILKAAYIEDDFVQPEGSLMLASASEWYTQAGTEYYNQHDVTKAKELLAESGYNGEPFKLLVSNAYQDFYNAALVIQQNLEEIGVNVELNVVDWATYLSQSGDETAFDAYITSCAQKTVPTQLYYLSTSAGWPTTDQKIVDFKNAINAMSNKEDAIAKWKEFQTYFWSESVPTSVIGDRFAYSVSTSKVQNMIYFEGPHAWNVVVEN